MFPINFNFPYRKKDGSIITMEKALDGAGADLDLIDLDDVVITTPVDDDGLVYDATAQKWENVPIMTKEQWKKNGAYNLLPQELYAPTTTSHNITWTVNADGSVSTSNTTKDSTNESFVLFSRTLGYTVPAGRYKFCGKPSATKYRMQLLCTRGGALTTLADLDYDTTSAVVTIQEGDALQVSLTVKSGETGGDTFYPLLTTDLSATNADFTTPAKTNRQLTEVNDVSSFFTGAPSTFTISASKCGKVVNISVAISSGVSGTKTFTAGIKPKVAVALTPSCANSEDVSKVTSATIGTDGSCSVNLQSPSTGTITLYGSYIEA